MGEAITTQGPTGASVFVGREREMAELFAALKMRARAAAAFFCLVENRGSVRFALRMNSHRSRTPAVRE